jgi:4-carboxymuconolactone decarboxylase
VTSVARIPKLEPAALDEDQRALYDAIAGGRRAQGPQLFRLTDSEGRLEGPFNAFLLQPRLGSALQALGSAVRYDTGLDDRCREIAILVVAAHWESEFEWYAHEAVGRSVGLGDAELAAVRDGRYTELTAARDGRRAARDGRSAARDGRSAARDGRSAALAIREAVVARTVAALVARGDLGDAEYREAVDHIGTPGLFELLTLVGYYATLALQLRVFRVPAPAAAATSDAAATPGAAVTPEAAATPGAAVTPEAAATADAAATAQGAAPTR